MTDFLDAMRPEPEQRPARESLCLRRIDHPHVSRFETSVTWCLLADGHSGRCSGPEPSIMQPEPPAQKRRMGWG